MGRKKQLTEFEKKFAEATEQGLDEFEYGKPKKSKAKNKIRRTSENIRYKVQRAIPGGKTGREKPKKYTTERKEVYASTGTGYSPKAYKKQADEFMAGKKWETRPMNLKQQGGYLQGKSHKEGGMAAIIGGQEPVELEGGEYIIKKSSVDKLGKKTLEKINKEGRIPTMANGGQLKEKPQWAKDLKTAGDNRSDIKDTIATLQRLGKSPKEIQRLMKNRAEAIRDKDKLSVDSKWTSGPSQEDLNKQFAFGKKTKVVNKKTKQVVPSKEQLDKQFPYGKKTKVINPVVKKKTTSYNESSPDPGDVSGSAGSKPVETEDREPKLITDQGHHAFKDSQYAILKYRANKRKTKDDTGEIIKKKKHTYSGQKTYDAQGNVISSTTTNKVVKPKKEVKTSPKKETRKEMYDRKNWRYDDTIEGYNKDGSKITTTVKKKVDVKPKDEKVVVTKSKDDDSGLSELGKARKLLLDEQKATTRQQKLAKKTGVKSKFRQKMDLKQRDLTSKRKETKAGQYLEGIKEYHSPKKVKERRIAKEEISRKEAAEKEKAKRMKKAKRSKSLLGRSINKMKDLLNRKGRNKRVEGNSGVGLKFQGGGYMPNAPIPAAPPFRQGMRMMGHGGETSVSNKNAAGGDPVAVHSHSGYKAGE